MKTINALGIAFSILLLSTSSFSFQLSQRTMNGLAGVYGYLTGQDLALRRIEQQFPELAQSVLLARLEFDAAYPRARQKVREQVINLAGESRATELLEQLEKNIETQASPKLTQDSAKIFLQTVSNRAQGTFERESIKQFLHSVVFYDRPESELSEKYSKRFSSAGDPKAKGVEVTIKIPPSWEERQGNTPNTIRSWTSEAGTGTNQVSLLIRDFGDKRTKDDIQRAIAKKDYSGMLPNSAVVKKIQLTESSNRYGWYVEFETTINRVDMELFGVHRLISLLHDGKTIEFGCSAGGLTSDKEKIKKEAERISSLCRLILNSLTIDSVYKR
jgi:hypothetical protein